ncbi:MAG: S-layer homology domain-containing protein [Clostridia bacterium]|nr:S-layer homology domain-containing protein [Clostridia bacterium]
MITNGKFEEYPAVDFAGRTVLVSRNINIQRSNWEPIENFKGTFNGQNYLINGLRVANTENAGLFGTVLSEAKIVDLTIEVDSVVGTVTAGALAGVNNGSIEHAVVTVKTEIAAPYAGGIAGVNNGSITDSVVKVVGTVQATVDAGGAAGKNTGSIGGTAVTVDGTVFAEANAGGIAGSSSGSVTESAVTVKGSLRGIGTAGGVAGDNSGSVAKPLVAIPAGGQILSDILAGGVIADNTGALTEPTIAIDGLIEAVNAGGIAGLSTTDLANGTVTGKGTVRGSAYAGGIVSQVIGISVTDSSIKDITVSGSALVGGVTGEINIFAIDNITVDGVILHAESEDAILGAVAGQTKDTATEIEFNGSVKATFNGEAQSAGGLVGNTAGNLTKLSVSAPIELTFAEEIENAGGVIGLASGKVGGTVRTGDTTLRADATVRSLGGMIGLAADDLTGTKVNGKTDLVATAAVASVGGLVGELDADLTDTEISGNITLSAKEIVAILGGIVGELHGDLDHLHYAGEIALTSEDTAGYVGGLVGRQDGEFAAVHTTGKIAVDSRGNTDGVGGIAGCFDGNANGIADGNNDINFLGTLTVDVTGDGCTVGGFAGVNGGTVRNLSLGDNVAVTVTAPTVTLGGFAGRNDGTLDYVYATTEIGCTAGEAAILGGLCGENSGTVKRSGTNVPVALTTTGAGESLVGGLCGLHTGAVSESYADCTVSCTGANARLGGLCGKAIGGSVTDCYASDAIGAQAPALLGAAEDTVVSTSYAASELPEDFADYDFDTVWQTVVSDGAKYAHPSLIRKADDGSVILNYDLRWYTKDPAAETFVLADEEDLAAFAMILNGRFEEFTDVDFAGRTVTVSAPMNLRFGNWEPIENFKGVFDGGEHLIDGLRVTATDSAGLFGTVLTEAEIKNLTLEAAVVDGTLTAGAVAGTNNGKIANAVVTVRDHVSAPDAGGVCGVTAGTVADTTVRILGAVEATANAGGVCGTNTGSIENADVTVDSALLSDINAGGIAGVSGGSITAPTVTVKGILGGVVNAGGIAAVHTGGITAPTVTVCEDAMILAPTLAGGIAADNSGSITEPNVILDGGIAADNAGGIAGVSTVDLANCTVSGSGKVSGLYYAGGILSTTDGVSLTDCTVSGITVSGGTHVGGIVGALTGGIVESAVVTDVKLTADVNTDFVGGIAGRVAVLDNADGLVGGRQGVYQGVYKSEVTGLSITAQGAEKVGDYDVAIGGLVGAIETGALYESKVTGEILASGYKGLAAGGAVGFAQNAYIAGNDASVGITAHYAQTYDIGGFVGKLTNSTVRFNTVLSEKPIEISYEDASAAVKGMYAGGFAGRINASADYTVSENTTDQDVRAISLFTQGGNVCVGGFAGQIGAEVHETAVAKSYALGDVYGDGKAYAYAGGFVGEIFKGSVELSYAAGNTVTAISPTGAYAGGFAGRLTNIETAIDNCYAVDGTVLAAAEGANAYAGAFYGNNAGTVKHSYADAASVIQVPKGVENIRDNRFILPAQDTALDAGQPLDGFDFAGLTWLFLDGENNGRPVLGVFADSAFMPDFDDLRGLDFTAFTVANADEFAAAVRVLNDISIEKLFTNGRVVFDNASITLADDIDLAGRVWIPLSALAEGQTLDGAGHTVSGLALDNAHAVSYGLIRENNGTVRDLTIAACAVTAGENAALLAGVNSGSIENVTVNADATLTGSGNAGALAGTNNGTVTGAHSFAAVAGRTAGGIVGLNNGTISDSETGATVSAVEAAEGQNSGGAVGVNNGTITGVTTSAKVSGYYAGGVAGTNGGTKAGTVSAAASTAKVSGEYAAGGIVGYNYKGTVGADDYGNVSSQAKVDSENGYAGGIAGINSGAGTVCWSDTLLDSAITGKYTGAICGSGGFDVETCRYEKCTAPKVDTNIKTFFTDDLTIALLTDVEGASIYYTLDGTVPTTESMLFDPAAPIVLTETTTVSAITFKSNMFASDVAKFTFTKLSGTGVPGSGGGGGGGGGFIIPAVEPTVRLAGDNSSVSVKVSVKDGAAVLGEAQINTNVAQEKALKLDLTGLAANSVSIPKALYDGICSTNAQTLTLQLRGASVTLDRALLDKAAQNTATGYVTLTLLTQEDAKARFTSAQIEATDNMDTVVSVSAELKCGETVLSDFGGGEVTVSVPFDGAKGETPDAIEVCYLADDGTATPIDANCAGGRITFKVGHFSEFVVTWCPIRLYTDLDEGSWYHDGIHYAIEHNVMQGVGNRLFMPNTNTNRAMIAQILYNIEGRPACSEDISYLDVAENAWYHDAIAWATAAGLVSGYGDGKFGPEDDLNREQLITVMYRYAKLKGEGFVGMWMFRLDYLDTAEISDWASEAMHWMVMNGVIYGTDGKLDPHGNASRAMIAAIVMRLETILAQ